MMSYAEKPEDITREEWMEKLNNVHVQRADMNRLIMNYLVTGNKGIFVIVNLLFFIMKNKDRVPLLLCLYLISRGF